MRLEVNQAGGFTAWIAGVPLTDTKGNVVTYTKQQISEWIGQKHAQSLRDLVIERNKEKKSGLGTVAPYKPDPAMPSIYAAPEEWATYRQRQAARKFKPN